MVPWYEKDERARAFSQSLHIGSRFLLVVQPNIPSADDDISIVGQGMELSVCIGIGVDTLASVVNPLHL